MKSLLILCLAGGATLATATANESNESTPSTSASNLETGSISGMVVWDGDRPEPKAALKIGEKESEGCCADGATVDPIDRSLMISEKGGVANVVLTLSVDGVELKVPEEPVILDQRGCRFEPHVVVAPVGATLRYLNTDGINHNVHSYSKKIQAVNNNVAGGTNFDQKLERKETFEVKCDIHPWMRSYVVVTDATHTATSGATGSFTIDGLPPGTYKLAWWHEELGKGKTEEVTVAAGAAANLEFKVGGKKKKGGGRRRR